MEVFFKNLSAEETPTERLVEDIQMLVNEAEDLVNKAEAGLPDGVKEEVKTALARLKSRCQQLTHQAMAGARQTDRIIRMHPYETVGIAFCLGAVVGLLAARKFIER
jgi:ElaB/YqjD/DUF883 family membrane-anchored ribosome-binding protein